jgi:hypothetical protein
LACSASGKIFVYGPDGFLFKEFDSDHNLIFCSSLYSSDEIVIGSIDKKYLRIHSLSSNATEPVSLLSDSVLFEDSSIVPTAFTQYTRLGKKM